MSITIVDYGMGNLGSIKNMLNYLGIDCLVTSDHDAIMSAKKLILPGVGAFDTAITNLNNLGLFDLIKKKMGEENSIMLGICLGMQLITDGSEEGVQSGFGFIKGKAKKFRFDGGNSTLRIPHIGWNDVVTKKNNPLINQSSHEANRFYFVHSYHVVCDEQDDVLAETNYGYQFTSAINKGNVYGVQFHPEKSHKFGLSLFENFAAL